MLEVMMPELKAATRDFYNMTGIKIVLYDEARRLLYSYPKGMCAFCGMVRENEALTKKCRAFDEIGFDMCERTRKPYIYKCHMGLAEAITPILEGDMIIGYMMMGQILCDGEEDRVRDAMQAAAAEHGLDVARFASGLAELRSVGDEWIRSALNVMSMCVCYLYNNKIIRSKSEDLCVRLKSYVDHHYTETLSIPELCRKMYLSKSKLYHLSVQTFGMGVSDYVRRKRIEEAKHLLETTELPISQIAERVGFHDANYFTRAFCREEDITPKQYRRNAQKR